MIGNRHYSPGIPKNNWTSAFPNQELAKLALQSRQNPAILFSTSLIATAEAAGRYRPVARSHQNGYDQAAELRRVLPIYLLMKYRL